MQINYFIPQYALVFAYGRVNWFPIVRDCLNLAVIPDLSVPTSKMYIDIRS